ncbi:Tetrapyrrole biosynthesis uroporphyrinogen III synthase [Penicillium verhagenii]|uniref:Tetrapyrrole biosynthesis uroporphyrinogen III synthase n=1 Tax=Penicillium verhagenii TaxID=1562060 RepID=UPI0025451FAA|nr:Tetrapyrrole biosynthesis uroporphyrinogen III synthase [Penicillium verhagenii]KAJ5935022.1 Tetrapyrrole biosynthesis uroporphyrinogen III synthase [Penicillium verhagenii]
MPSKTPILLLKTRSSPHDGYDDFLSTQGYDPSFVPVLEHRFNTNNLAQVRDLFASGAFELDNAHANANAKANADTNIAAQDESTPTETESTQPKKYGGMIFTSQRAVEGFAAMIERDGLPLPPPSTTAPFPLYTVGPATARTLTTLRDKHLPSATIHGADAGTGENLAYLMLDHYNALHPRATATATNTNKPGLLFLVGEQRRDIIPKTLMAPSLAEARIPVDEIVVYETGEMESFERDFEAAVQRCVRDPSASQEPWVVVFSPSGCEAMLRVLGLGPFAKTGGGGRRVFVATIGPTTRDYLRGTFGFEADVCAEKPSPQGVLEGIRKFVEGRRGI